MNIPTLPTDNLYRFMALSGLVVFIFSLIFPSIQIDELELKSIEAQTEVAVLEVELEMLQEDVDKAAHKTQPTNEEMDRLQTRMAEMRVKTAQIKGKNKELRALDQDLKLIRGVLIAVIPLSAFMMTLGFALWYRRVQKPSDRLLWKRLENERALSTLKHHPNTVVPTPRNDEFNE